MKDSKLVSVTLPGGKIGHFSVDANNIDSYQAAVAAGHFFDPTWKFTNGLVHEGSVVFDIGANIGVYTIPLALKGAQVHAFELLEDNVRHLKAAIAANHIEQNVSLVHAAVSDSAGTASALGVSAWGFVDDDASTGAIPKITIDEYVGAKNIEHIDVMKIDIEGSERAAFNGMQNTLRRDKPDIVFESNALTCGAHKYSYRELLSFLSNRAYRLFRIQDGWLWPWKEERIQEVVCVDYYATMKTDAEIAAYLNWAIREPTRKELFQSIASGAVHTDVHKHYVAVIASRLPLYARLRFCVQALRWSFLCDNATRRMLRLGSA